MFCARCLTSIFHLSFPDDVIAEPYQTDLTETETMVIDCLKQLTHAVFRPHFKMIDEPFNPTNGSPSKMNMTMTMSPSKLTMTMSPSKMTISPSKSRSMIMNKRIEDAMSAAEQYCSLVAQQIIKSDDGGTYNRQLDVYHSTHKSLFEENHK